MASMACTDLHCRVHTSKPCAKALSNRLPGFPVQLRRAKGCCAPAARWNASSRTWRFHATSAVVGASAIRSSASAANSAGCARARSARSANMGGRDAADPSGATAAAKQANARKRSQPIGAELRLQGHGFRVPHANALLEVADVREQRRTRRTEAEHGIFHHRLAAAHGGDEVAMVIEVIAVTMRWLELILLHRPHAIGIGRPRRILRVIFLQKRFLQRFGESLDSVAGLGFARRL